LGGCTYFGVLVVRGKTSVLGDTGVIGSLLGSFEGPKLAVSGDVGVECDFPLFSTFCPVLFGRSGLSKKIGTGLMMMQVSYGSIVTIVDFVFHKL